MADPPRHPSHEALARPSHDVTMRRGAGIGVLAAAAIAAWVHSTNRTPPVRPRANGGITERSGAPPFAAGYAAGARSRTAGQLAGTPVDVEQQPAFLDGLSLLDTPFATNDASGRRDGGWRIALEQLDDVLAGFSALGLDALLDLDLDVAVPDDVRTATAESTPERTSDTVLASAEPVPRVEPRMPTLLVGVAGRPESGRAIASAPSESAAGERQH